MIDDIEDVVVTEAPPSGPVSVSKGKLDLRAQLAAQVAEFESGGGRVYQAFIGESANPPDAPRNRAAMARVKKAATA